MDDYLTINPKRKMDEIDYSKFIHDKRIKINFKAVKIVNKPVKVKFWTKDGKEVIFKGFKTFIKRKLNV